MEALRLDNIVSPLLRKGQSLHHICISHADEIMQHERTLYRYVDSGIFTARNIDMPRVMRMGRRKQKKDAFKVDMACRLNRTYLDYKQFMADQPGLPVVEIDSVEGTKGGKVLLTIHFVSPQLMLAFLRDANTSQSVIDIFNQLDEDLGPETFRSSSRLSSATTEASFQIPLLWNRIRTDSRGRGSSTAILKRLTRRVRQKTTTP